MNLLLKHPCLPHYPPTPHPLTLTLTFTRTHSLSLPTKPTNPNLLTKPHSSLSPHYNGWDIPSDQTTSNSTHFLFNSLDQNYVFLFLLGAVSALTLSRARLFPLFLLPALAFAAGFSLRTHSGIEKSAKGESFRGLGELVRFFDEFDVKVGNLRRAVENGDLGLVGLVEEVRVLGLGGRRVVEGLGDRGGSLDGKRKEGGIGFWKFVGGMVGESSKSGGKVRGDGVKKNVARGRGEDRGGSGGGSEENGLDSDNGELRKSNVASDMGKESVFSGASEKERLDSVGDASVRGKEYRGGGDEQRRVGEMIGNASRFVGREEYSYRSDRMRFVNERRVSSNMVDNSEHDVMGGRGGSMRDSVNFSLGMDCMESEASFVEERRVKESSRGSDSKYNWKHYDNEVNRPESLEENIKFRDEVNRPELRKENIKFRDEVNRPELREENMKFKDDFQVSDDQSAIKSDFVSYMSAASADDVAFDRYLAEANDLLKNAREYVAVGRSEEHAEVMLYESANLLSKATNMKPMSLLAVGQLGNTYLIHGELKLKTSRELRAVLSGSQPLSVEKLGTVLKGLDDQVVTRNKLTSALIDVCEECEGLLLEAGRKYRLALTIDGSDVRALYNWGLALSYRAQLIADVGPEAAADADKIFLAAIDKFDAMLSRGNDHAPEALFKWGVALQQRSRLRPRNSKEKVKLLQQAKRLFEDALLMGSESVHVRDALLSCVSELNYRNY